MTPPSGRSHVTPPSPVSFLVFIRAISNHFDIIFTSGQTKKAFIMFSHLAMFGVI